MGRGEGGAAADGAKCRALGRAGVLGGSAPNFFQMEVCTLTRIACLIASSIPERQWTTSLAKL
jgi:hypothetical protein